LSNLDPKLLRPPPPKDDLELDEYALDEKLLLVNDFFGSIFFYSKVKDLRRLSQNQILILFVFNYQLNTTDLYFEIRLTVTILFEVTTL
jgi:hypothetical protein